MSFVTGVVYEHECEKEIVQALFNAYARSSKFEMHLVGLRTNLGFNIKEEQVTEKQIAFRQEKEQRPAYRNYTVQGHSGSLKLPFARATFASKEEAQKFREYLEQNMSGAFFGPHEI